MYIQAEELEVHGNFAVNIPNNNTKTEICKDLSKSHKYVSKFRGNTLSQPEPYYLLESDSSVQRKRMFLHSFLRNANESPLPSYSGSWTSISEPQPLYKAYFDVTLPTPPNKSTVYDIMERCRKTAEYKSMPFIQLVGDQPVYALILEIKNENPELFEKILPVLGGFHTSCAFLSVIYRRFKGSGLSDLAVAAGMVESGSVDAAIRGGHYKRGMRIHKLIYECLIRMLIQEKEINDFSKSLKEKLQKPSDFLKFFDEDEGLSQNVDEMIKSYLSQTCMDSPMASFWLSYLEMVEISLHA